MSINDITLPTVEHIEETASEVISHPAQPEGSNTALREGQLEQVHTRPPMDELGSYAGEQVNSLNVIASEGLNLTKLESRPRPGTPWEYAFYLDVEGHVAEPRMQAALAGLAARTVFLKVLGCYPARELPRTTSPS